MSKLSDYKIIRIAKIIDDLILWTENENEGTIKRWKFIEENKENKKLLNCLKSLEKEWAK